MTCMGFPTCILPRDPSQGTHKAVISARKCGAAAVFEPADLRLILLRPDKIGKNALLSIEGGGVPSTNLRLCEGVQPENVS
jgi:hypothetical protein